MKGKNWKTKGRRIRKKNLAGGKDKSRELDTILDAIYEDILIADGKGVILRVSSSFERVYGISGNAIVGKTVFEMEENGVFKPSVIARVLREQEKITMWQKNSQGRTLLVTAVPLRDRSGEIEKVISFTRDLTDFLNLRKQCAKLRNSMEKCSAEIAVLRNNSLVKSGIVGRSPGTQEILKTLLRVAPFDANVLLTGESGTGKTMFAKFLHEKSSRQKGPFIEINCGAIPETLIESELFGYEKGSFTGALKEGKMGLIELAGQGTLFLDEISELPFNLQVKILKVIQDKKVTRVGGTRERQVDFRLVAASNKDMETLVRENRFREDLYYRLNVISVHLPPLRECPENILPMIRHYLDQFNRNYGLEKRVSGSALKSLSEYSWPGNVRELENMMERLVLTSENETVEVKDLPASLREKETGHALKPEGSLPEVLKEVEKQMVREAYNRFKTTVGVAKALGISQPTAVRKIRKYCR